jgi:hypothetical protein
MAGWDICKMMCRAGGSSLEQAIAEADDAMPPQGLPVASERALRQVVRAGALGSNKRQFTRTAAEDLRCSLCAQHQRAMLQISSVGNVNVSFIDIDLK